MQFWKWLLGAGSIAVIAAMALRGVMLRVASRQRLAESQDRDQNEAELDDEARGPVGRWLALAGYRSPGAVGAFWTVTAAMSGLGAVLALIAHSSGLLNVAIQGLESIPGAVGEIFVPVIQYAPWILIVILAFAPCTVVRARRRRIVTEVEQDLPLVLELLATLGESGLGFDAAIARIIDSQPGQRPLTTELRNFQRETLTGRPRIASLRRLARRIDVQSLTIFVSAVVHAEQVGSSVSDVLRRQADDVRDRRRERALNLAQSLPVKLLFPLVICFLPAIFVFTLGPVFLQFFQFAEALLNRRVVR